MAEITLLGLQERKRELQLKRHYAYARYIAHDAEAQKAMRIMSQVDNDLLVLEFDFQKLTAAESMQASDKAWSDKEGGGAKMVLKYPRFLASKTECEQNYVQNGDCSCTDEVMCDWCYFQSNQD